MKRIAGYLLGGFIVLFLGIQLVPYGRDHSNPPVVNEPEWNAPETRALVVRACFDCHSNETVWPFYTHIAPLSWMVQNHVDDGREHLNFSEWGDGHHEDIDEIVEEIESGNMPLASYLPGHPEARLNADEQAQLIEGLRASIGSSDSPHDDENHEHSHDH